MTAITLNLLVEEQMAQDAQARDPVKLVAACGICAITVAVLLGMVVSRFTARRTAEAEALQAKWSKLESNPSAAIDTTKSYKALAEDIHAINHTRPLYASQLAVIKDVVPETIRLTQINFTFVTEDPTASPELPPPGENGGKPARKPQTKVRQRLALVLTGQAESARPEIAVDEFIKKMQAYPALSNVVDEVRLRSIARTAVPTDVAEKKAPTTLFSIECQYKSLK
jgi:hypothetical protein